MKVISLLTVFLMLISACSADTESTQSSPKAESTTASAKNKHSSAVVDSQSTPYRILFFLDPTGAPCQMQDQILKDLSTELSQHATVQYVSTKEMQTSRPLFMQYGIRALPSMVILNADGSIHHRFTPGIQAGETVLEKLKG